MTQGRRKAWTPHGGEPDALMDPGIVRPGAIAYVLRHRGRWARAQCDETTLQLAEEHRSESTWPISAISPVLAHSSPFLAVASGAGSTAGKRGPRLIVPCANERSNENLANRWHDRIPEAVPGFRSLVPLRSAKIGICANNWPITKVG